MSLTAQHSLPQRAAYTDEPIFRLTVDQYHELIRSGKLTDDDPVELLEGILVFKMPKNTPHATATRLCRRAVEPLLPAEWFYDAQDPITLADGEPEPDGMVVRGRIEDYVQRHPGPGDIALVIEVADSSLERDRGIKMRSYARAGIPVYWILDLGGRGLEIYADPDPNAAPDPAYRRRDRLGGDQTVGLVLAGRFYGEIPVAAMLPPSQ